MSNNSEAPRLAPDERREQILRVATSHMSRKDCETASVPAIALEAGVTRALVYHYFPGMEALRDAVLHREAETLLSATAPDPALSPRENLQKALGAYLDHFSSSAGELRNLYAGTSPLARKLAARNHAIQVERVLTTLALKKTPVLRLAVASWLAFVTEAARQMVVHPTASRAAVIRLCVDTLQAATGVRLQPDAVTKPARPTLRKK